MNSMQELQLSPRDHGTLWLVFAWWHPIPAPCPSLCRQKGECPCGPSWQKWLHRFNQDHTALWLWKMLHSKYRHNSRDQPQGRWAHSNQQDLNSSRLWEQGRLVLCMGSWGSISALSLARSLAPGRTRRMVSLWKSHPSGSPPESGLDFQRESFLPGVIEEFSLTRKKSWTNFCRHWAWLTFLSLSTGCL